MKRYRAIAQMLVTACAAVLVSSCSSSDAPTNEIFTLVDLSETWLNPASANRNRGVLEEVGEGIVSASETLPPPFAVQYRIIGDASYERLPVCDVIYRPALVNTTKAKPGYLITRPKKFRHYLGVDCPAALLGRSPEPLTEISAAIASVAAKPRPAGAHRTLIIVSDFLEEGPAPTPLDDYDFTGVRVLLLYRPIAGQGAASTRQRVADWQQTLQSRGAKVVSWPDTALKRTDVATYLTQR